MKRSLLFSIVLLFFCLGFQFAGAQNYWDFDKFFRSKNFMPCRTIAQLIAPNNEYINGFCKDVSYPDGTDKKSFDIYVEVSFDAGTIYVKLHLNKTCFDQIEISSSSDWVEPFSESDVIKAFASDMIKTYKKDEIKWIENKFGSSLYDLNTKQLCLAALTLQYWKNDY